LSGWIKLEKDLLTDPRFVATAMDLEERYGLAHKGVSERNVTTLPASTLLLGALARIWIIADTHIGEDDILALNAHQIDKLVGIKGLCEILPDDWLQVLDGDRVKLPNYHAHNGSTAKERSGNALRQQRFRDKHKQISVTSRNAVTLPDLDKTKTREDSEKNKPTAATRPSRNAPDPEFVRFKVTFPARAGSQPWNRALKAINARLSEGHSWAEIIAGAQRYADFIVATGKLNTEFTMQAAAFCGPDKHFLHTWALPTTKAETRLNGNLSAAEEFMRRTETHQ
jgi:hypothetical protein